MPHGRLRFIRSAEKSAYFSALSEILDRSDTDDKTSLKAILTDHWRWHHGEYEGIDDLFMHEAASHRVLALQRTYRAFLLNTTGRLKESNELLAGLAEESSEVLAYLSDFMGESALSIINSWVTWNAVEMLDVSAFHYATVKCMDQLSDSRVLAKSKAQFCLAVGIGALRFENHQLARFFLDHAHSLLPEGSIWLPRVASAKALLELSEGDEIHGRQWLDVARSGLPTHFGPMGWQLRIAEAHLRLNEQVQAIEIVESVLAHCLEKREHIYSGWARIFLMELMGDTPNKGNYFPFESPYSECHRLQLHTLKRGIVIYD